MTEHTCDAGVQADDATGVGRARALTSVRADDRLRWKDFLWSGLSVILMTLFAKAVEPWVGYPSIDLFYLVPVILAATLFGLRPGIATGIASGIFYNFFFLPPLHTFVIHDPQDVITAIVLVLVAVVTSQLAGRVRAQAKLGEQRARENAAIASFVGTLGTLSNEAETARTICFEIGRLFDTQAILLRKEGREVEVAAASPGVAEFDPPNFAVIGQAFECSEGETSGALESLDSQWRFWPLRGNLGTIALLGLRREDGSVPVPESQAVLFSSVVERAARAFERLRVEAQMRHVAALRERDHLRATLLSSIGHDLRTPLTAVTAAAEAMRPDEKNADLVATIRSEARRLGRFFDNLIDITRIESGALAPKVELVDLTDSVGAALEDVKLTLEGRSVHTEVSANLPLVRADPTLLHHILINLLANAAKFSPDGSKIRLTARTMAEGLELSISDEGQGLPPGRESMIFDTFARLEGSDRSGGTGLGLAIVKGFAQAMGLSVTAANKQERNGARFSLIFPSDLLRDAARGDS